MIVLAIDPGNTHSALVLYDAATRRVLSKRKLENHEALVAIRSSWHIAPDHLAIEMAESFGAKVWSQVFTTVLWTGRFIEAWTSHGLPFTLVTRREVKNAVAGEHRANDAQIRNALIDRWGGKEVAIGSKHAPGPLHGVTADCWAALAIAVTFADAQRSKAA